MTIQSKMTEWMGRFLLAGIIAPGMMLGLACQSSTCETAADCNDGNAPVPGQQYVCQDGLCVIQGGPERDAGAQVDAGIELDAGMHSDAGLETDAGTPPDAGHPPEPRDAGVEMDGGTGTDAGTNPGLSCEKLPHDSRLGTLKLHSGFTAGESVQFPSGVTAITTVPSGGSFKLYGVRNTNKSLYALGTWPNITLGATALQHVIAPEDRSSVVFLRDFLINDGSRLLTGYIKGGANGAGNVFIYDLAAPTRSLYMPAPGNESAAADGSSTSSASAFFVNGAGLEKLGAAGGNAAIYALKTRTQPFQAMMLATFSPEWAAVSGPSAKTSNGIAVFGYFSGTDALVHLRAVPPSVYSHALSTGRSFSLADWPEVHVGESEGLLIAGFGNGLAVHRGAWSLATGEMDTRDVLWIPLLTGTGGTPVVHRGQPVPLLVSNDSCTNVTFLVPMGKNLLVGLSDKNGERLVQLKER